MAETKQDSESVPPETGSNKRKNEEKDPPKNDKSHLSKFTINYSYSLTTKKLRQEAFVLSPSYPKPKKQKSSTSKKQDGTSNSPEGEASDDELHEPTEEELKEAAEPANILSIITFREKKRRNHKKRLDAKAEKESKKNVKKIKEYLQKWKNNKAEWKFEKLKQIYLINTMFDEDKVNDELWPIALEYLSGTKGSAKASILEIAETEIQNIDREVESTGDNDLMNQVRYTRAREVLQNLG